MQLHTLQDTHRTRKQSKRVGRGIGSGKGKTCGRGERGRVRSGYTRRYGYEGGQFRLYMKLPTRGFSNALFKVTYDTINLDQLDKIFNDGELVSLETLTQKGFFSGSKSYGLKILGNGVLTKKVTIEAHAYSQGAKEKLELAKISFTTLE